MSLEGCTISLVEDDPIMGESLVQCLTLEGCKVNWWKTGAEAVRGVGVTEPDLVVCDIRLPDTDGETVFRRLANAGSVPPFLFVTGFANIDQAVALMRAGAADYITKPFDMPGFIARVGALISRKPQAESATTLGVSEPMQRVEAMLLRFAGRTTPVLITGETGVGKEVCARFLHCACGKTDRPFVAINCAAVPSELMESELFGHDKGAFSGATSQHKGYAERAGDGTLFLDEIGDMPLALQAKLLRLIEDRQFTRVGGEQPLAFRARVVCATNTRLETVVAERRFREDLFYRINVMTVTIPSLRNRLADIPWLMHRFLEEFRCAAEPTLKGFSTLAEQAAIEHPWPGNVRELRNRIERAVVLTSGPSIMPCELFPELCADELPETPRFVSLRAARDEAERRQIERALRETGGQLIEAGRLLDVSRTTLWEKMKRLGVVVPDGE